MADEESRVLPPLLAGCAIASLGFVPVAWAVSEATGNLILGGFLLIVSAALGAAGARSRQAWVHRLGIAGVALSALGLVGGVVWGALLWQVG